jgi:uncharacterized membrane protein
MELVELLLLAAALTCALTAGLLFAFAVVVMPGLGELGDSEYLRSFQVIDRVIQNNQPLFLLVFAGSVVTVVAAAVAGVSQLDGADRWILAATAAAYALGAILPTVTINVPLNNRVQACEVATTDAADLATLRQTFEARWNRWNVVRTVVSIATALVLLVLLLRS